MTQRNITRAGAVAAAALLPIGLVLAATPAGAADDATVSVLHGIPEGLGADVVDVYANGNLLIDDFTPGSLETATVPAGSYDLGVYADGTTPEDSDPVLSADGVEVPAGINATVTANLDAEGNPALNVFVNDTATIAAGEARLTVRHVAAAPAVDILADGAVLFSNLTNPNQDLASVPAGSYEAAVNLAGTDTTAIGPADVSLEAGANTIVYAWGSAADETLALAVQVIPGLGATPDGVPAGDGSTTGTPVWALGLAAVAALGLVGAGARLSAARR
ncbi:MAG: DUF4397 domain-containing protein [Candidatus Nanopelagicales bacterium]|jgi:hypothetical protein